MRCRTPNAMPLDRIWVRHIPVAVHVPDALLQMLSEHVALGLPYDWMFAAVEDVPPHQYTIGHRWRMTLQKAGVEGARLHDLLHFYASGLIALGCDVVAVQRALALGHAKSTTTLRRTPICVPQRRTASGTLGRACSTKSLVLMRAL